MQRDELIRSRVGELMSRPNWSDDDLAGGETRRVDAVAAHLEHAAQHVHDRFRWSMIVKRADLARLPADHQDVTLIRGIEPNPGTLLGMKGLEALRVDDDVGGARGGAGRW